MALQCRIRRATVGADFVWDDGHERLETRGEAAVLEAQGEDRCEQVRQAAAAIFADMTVVRDPGVPDDIAPRWFGGMSFHPDHVDVSPWQGLPSARFVLPECMVIRRADGAYEIEMSGTAGKPAGRARAPPDPPEPQRRSQWNAMVATARQTILDGELSKVVLARCTRADPCDVEAVLEKLAAAEPECTRFVVRVGDREFFGATPEWLVRYDGHEVRTHALAGTARRGGDVAADDELGRALLSSPKDILEHELVASYLRDQLRFAGAVGIEQGHRRLRRLGRVQHLETPVHGRAEGLHILGLVHQLHPTPAVCGTPPDLSRQWISKLERFPRGWYAGTVGWFDASGQGRFAVALRCALRTPISTWLFAGAGIVAGSDPDKEWAETDAKLAALQEALA